MISQSEQEVLKEICRSSNKGLFDIRTLLGKVYDEDLAMDLNRQAAKYSGLQEKAENSLLESGVMPDSTGIFDKAKRWAVLKAGTARNISTGHIADLMVKEKENQMQNLETVVKNNSVISSMSY